jgi:hypothetical protein
MFGYDITAKSSIHVKKEYANLFIDTIEMIVHLADENN